MNHQIARVVLVVAGSAAAFIGLAFLIYWLYFTVSGTVYDARLDKGLASLQALFYTALVLHILGSLGTAAALTIRARAPMYTTLAVVSLVYAILGLPMLWVLSFVNFCETNVSFPIPREWSC